MDKNINVKHMKEKRSIRNQLLSGANNVLEKLKNITTGKRS